MTSRLSAKDVLFLLKANFKTLQAHQDEINKLNVYPVPDGDTGTNLVLTLKQVIDEADKLNELSMSSLMEAATHGSLLGARGNSGVILSQIIRGAAEIFTKADIISLPLLIEAMKNAATVSRQAIRKPVEGTMLTVMKDVAQAASSFRGQDVSMEVFFGAILEEAEASVERTPELLSVLKEAGVVDAGGYGLLIMGKGMQAWLRGEELEEVAPSISSVVEEEVPLTYTYCTEFLLKSDGVEFPSLENRLESLGDSVMVVGERKLCRVHVHTNDPGKVLEIGTSLGSISQVQINNMVEQAEERRKALLKSKAVQKVRVSVVAVANGKGIKDVFQSLGAARIVEGGQSMNPSASKLLEAIEDVPSLEVIVLPNNNNIVLAAEQAAGLSKKKVKVVATSSLPQGFSAMLEFDSEKSLPANSQAMSKALKRVKTGEVTKSSRKASSKLGEIAEGTFIGLYNGEICTYGDSFFETACELIDKMVEGKDETLTLLKGSQLEEKEAQRLAEALASRYPNLEIEVIQGQQPLYPLIIGLE